MKVSTTQSIALSARDPATVQALTPVVLALEKQTDFDLTLFLQTPANQLFDVLSLTRTRVIEIDTVTFSKDQAVENWVAELGVLDVLQQSPPNLLITGVSGPGVGIDEALIYLAPQLQIPSMAVQTYWSGFNRQLGVLPDYALAIDDGAVLKNLRHSPDVVSFPVGSLRHVSYQGLDVKAQRINIRNRKSLADQQAVVWLGQPLEHLAGYYQTLESFLDFFQQRRRLKQRLIFCYRPHPKETQQQRQLTQSLICDALGDDWLDLSQEHFADCLMLADLVVSCFSSGGFDSVCLNEKSTEPYANSLYLLYDDEVRDWYQRTSHTQRIPIVEEGFALAVDRFDQLPTIFDQALDAEIRNKLWRKAKQHLPPVDQAISLSLDVIDNLLNNSESMILSSKNA